MRYLLNVTPLDHEGTSQVLALSNVYDDQYHQIRGEEIRRVMSSAKRRDLFHCIEMATERELIVLSSPPKADIRRSSRWLPAIESKFSTHRQLFCSNWDTPKLRIPLSWFFYARHVLSHTRDGDILIIDNYEIIYVIATLYTRIFRRVTIVLDYEDGKHLIDQGWMRILSGLAEFLARPFLQGALLAHPSLSGRLPTSLPTVLIPGFVVPRNRSAKLSMPVRFLYSGSLDRPRGLDMLLRAIELLPENGWHLDISGCGIYETEISRIASSEKYADRVTYHGALKQAEHDLLTNECHVGLNCQRSEDPISGVTFPSKIFSYLSAGLVVLSSHASDVYKICGSSLLYFQEETPESLAAAMIEIINDLNGEKCRVDGGQTRLYFSIKQTSRRLRDFFQKIND
jgi:glycosyltransferase involved in cell wall biosynthesis